MTALSARPKLERRDRLLVRSHFYVLFTGFTNVYTMTDDDTMTQLGHDGGDSLSRSRFYSESGATKRSFLYAYIHLFHTKQCIYPPSGFYFQATMEKTRFQVVLYAYIHLFHAYADYAHLQGFILVQRRRGLAFRVMILFWHYERLFLYAYYAAYIRFTCLTMQ